MLNLKTVPAFVLILAACQPSLEPAAPNVEQKSADSNLKLDIAEESLKQKVVYHINYDDPQKQIAALHSIKHHLDAAGKRNIDIRVVLHGRGLSLLMETDSLAGTKLSRANANHLVQARISQLKDDGVVFNVCENSLRSNKIDYQQDLYDVAKADLVENGISEIIELQTRGYMYLKP